MQLLKQFLGKWWVSTSTWALAEIWHDLTSKGLIKFDKHILCQILSNLRLNSASTEPTNILGKIWFGSLGNHQIVSLRLPSKFGPIVKSSGQAVDIYDTAGTSKSVAPSSLIELECFMQLLHKDGFGDILWNEYGDNGFVTIYAVDPKLIADFRKSGITQVVSGNAG